MKTLYRLSAAGQIIGTVGLTICEDGRPGEGARICVRRDGQTYKWGVLSSCWMDELESFTRKLCERMIAIPLVQWVSKRIMRSALDSTLEQTMTMTSNAGGICSPLKMQKRPNVRSWKSVSPSLRTIVGLSLFYVALPCAVRSSISRKIVRVVAKLMRVQPLLRGRTLFHRTVRCWRARGKSSDPPKFTLLNRARRGKLLRVVHNQLQANAAAGNRLCNRDYPECIELRRSTSLHTRSTRCAMRHMQRLLTPRVRSAAD